MLRYCCDMCSREIDPVADVRYVVSIDVTPALDAADTNETEDDRDHLQEINELLQRIEAAEDQGELSAAPQQLRYDLCADCHRRFVKNPLGKDLASQLNFSEN